MKTVPAVPGRPTEEAVLDLQEARNEVHG